MKEEIVDIVDDKNNVIASISKTDAHKKGLLHKTVISQVIDSQGRFTLVLQSSDRQDAGQYVSPVGGHVSTGETEEEAFKREALEEVGLQDFEFHYVGKAIFNRNILGRQENHFFFLYEIFSDKKIVLNHEAVSFKPFTKEELKQVIMDTPEKFGSAFYFVFETFYPNLLPDNYIKKF
jgi:isopentenyl-diphosphate delta-isomerase